jgi:hypothetical protein
MLRARAEECRRELERYANRLLAEASHWGALADQFKDETRDVTP